MNLDEVLAYAKELFKNNESEGQGEQVPKALKLLELVATEDLKAKEENREFNPDNVEVNIEEIAPDPVKYAEERGYWDGGDDEDYFTCCFDYGGDGDLLQVAKECLSKEARHYMEDTVEEIMKVSSGRLEKMYE